MVEKLKTYRAEILVKRDEIINTPIDVEAAVEAYRIKLTEEEEAKKAAAIAKCDSDIDCIDTLIAREEDTVIDTYETITTI